MTKQLYRDLARIVLKNSHRARQNCLHGWAWSGGLFYVSVEGWFTSHKAPEDAILCRPNMQPWKWESVPNYAKMGQLRAFLGRTWRPAVPISPLERLAMEAE